MKTKVRLRETGHFVTINITGENKPQISEKLTEKWQSIINLVANIFSVPAALIMKVTSQNMEVFLKSENEENPYPSDGKDKLGHGLYCETVIGTNKELAIENAFELDKWKDNPDVALNMISYYGLPLKWPNGAYFGTICALDNKPNVYRDVYRKFLMEAKKAIETDLEMLETNEKLVQISIHDFLTQAYNRRYAVQKIEELCKEHSSTNESIAVIMFDFDKFKRTNDKYGHIVGDKILIQVVEIISKILGVQDFLARYGGDEFLVVLRETNEDKAKDFIKKYNQLIAEDSYLHKYKTSISSGIAIISKNLNDFDSIVREADFKMLEIKRKNH
ncbi:MAG: GGDEF domain-containing protein [Bacilli bacterium]|nr:GGDEF domain-containing protein [Bacilli bacterium]